VFALHKIQRASIKSNLLKVYRFAVDVDFVGSRNHPRYIKIPKSEKPDYTLGWIGILIMIVGAIMVVNMCGGGGSELGSNGSIEDALFICFVSLFFGLLLVWKGEQKAGTPPKPKNPYLSYDEEE